MWPILASVAMAATVDDLATAAQRGMSPELIQTLAAELEAVSSEDVIRLLRSGVTAETIRLIASDHPTAEELQAAEEAGPLAYAPPPKEYRGLTARAWFPLIGSEVVIRLSDEVVTGILTNVDDTTEEADTLVLWADGAERTVERARVMAVRRVDGAPVAVSTERDREDAAIAALEPKRTNSAVVPAVSGPQLSQRRRTGNAMIGAGATLTGVGLLSFAAYQSQLSKAAVAADRGDVDRTSEHASAATGWATLGYVSLVTGVPSLTAGIVLVVSDD